jgi:hypothetical protein
MTDDGTEFERHLADSLRRLAQAAPAGPDAARVLGALRGRQAARGAVALAATCVLVAAGAMIWPNMPQPSPTGPPRPEVVRTTPVSSQPPLMAEQSIMPPLPGLAFGAAAVTVPLPAVRTEFSPLSIPGSLRGPAPARQMNCYLPGLTFATGPKHPDANPNERKLQ